MPEGAAKNVASQKGRLKMVIKASKWLVAIAIAWFSIRTAQNHAIQTYAIYGTPCGFWCSHLIVYIRAGLFISVLILGVFVAYQVYHKRVG